MKDDHFGSKDWRERVNPAFIQYWSASKRLHTLDANDPQEMKKALDEFGAASRILYKEESRIKNASQKRVWQEVLRPLDGEVWPWPERGETGKGYAVNPESTSFFRDLVFLLLGITFRELIVQLERDPKVYPKLFKVHRAYYRLRAGKASFRDLKLKYQSDHFSMMVQGFDFGLAKLNEFALAACFDEICPCGRHRHSTGTLSKFRISMNRAHKHLQDSMGKTTTIDLQSD